MRSPTAQIIAWERSSYSNWVKSLRRLNAHPVLNCRQNSKDERRKNNLTHCQPFFFHKKGTSREAKHGTSQEQVDHFKANESRHAMMRGYSSVLERFQNDDVYRNSQIAIGWTEEKWTYLDSLLLEDKSHTSTRRERIRYENNWALGMNGQGPTPGPTKQRTDYPQAVTKVKIMRQQAEQPSNPPIPSNRQVRQRPIEERQKAERQQWRWKAWPSSPSSSSQASSSTEWHGHQRGGLLTKWENISDF